MCLVGGVQSILVSKLIKLKKIRGAYFVFDSSNILVTAKKNNLQISIKDRFDKNERPKGDPKYRLSIIVNFSIIESATNASLFRQPFLMIPKELDKSTRIDRD